MEFDIRTILFLLFLVSGLSAIMLFLYWKTQKTYEGFGFWTWGTILSASGYLFIVLRGTIPPLVSILAANVLIILGVLLRVDGISRFSRKKPIPKQAYGTILIPFVLLFLYFTYVQDSIVIRALVSSAVIGPCLVLTSLYAVELREVKNRFINYSFATVLIIGAGVFVLRSIYWLFVAPPASIFSTDNLNILFFTIDILMNILAAGFFLMLNMVRTQNDLSASEERYHLLADSLPDYVVIHDGSTILYANPATARFAGIPEEELRGLPLARFIAAESKDTSRSYLERLSTSPRIIESHEIVILSPDGQKHICIIRSVPFRVSGTAAILSVLTDITERKQMEDALRMINRKMNLLSGITRHDIRNQLTALMAFIHLSEEATAKDPLLHDYALKEKKIATIIARQLDFARDYENLGVKAPAWQDVDSLVRNAASTLPLRSVTLTSACSGIEIFADPLLGIVFYNLIENSLRHGGDALTAISVSAAARGNDLCVIYEDNGTGIPAADKQKIFDQGFGKNTGLGLFFSREILSITGLTITENGEPGRGARFEIVVPRGQYRPAA